MICSLLFDLTKNIFFSMIQSLVFDFCHLQQQKNKSFWQGKRLNFLLSSLRRPDPVFQYLLPPLDWSSGDRLTERFSTLGIMVTQMMASLKPFGIIVLWYLRAFRVPSIWWYSTFCSSNWWLVVNTQRSQTIWVWDLFNIRINFPEWKMNGSVLYHGKEELYHRCYQIPIWKDYWLR